MTDFPYLYTDSYAGALQRRETRQYDASFQQNIVCARAVEQAIQEHADKVRRELTEGCAQSVLARYGFNRVNYVLSNSVNVADCRDLISKDAQDWVRNTCVHGDGHNCRFAVNTTVDLLDKFIGQVKACYQALGLFGQEHCVDSQDQQDYTGKVLILSPFSMEESCWDTHSQLWLAEEGFGCYPGTYGWSLYATCLGSGEQARWDRSNFIGIMKEEYLPDWARVKLKEIQAPKQSGPTMNI